MNQPEVFDLSRVIEDHLIDNCSLLEPEDGEKSIATLVAEAIEKYLDDEQS
jgi:hypothetical protein